MAVLPHAQGCVVGKLFYAIGQLAPHAYLGTLVCFVARVTGIYLHWSEAELPALHACTNMRCPWKHYIKKEVQLNI